MRSTALSRLSRRVRLRFASGADPNQIWQEVHGELKHLLTSPELHQVTIERAEELPEQGRGGKFRVVIPLAQAGPPADRHEKSEGEQL